MIKENKATEDKQIIEQKIGWLSKERLEGIEKGWLI